MATARASASASTELPEATFEMEAVAATETAFRTLVAASEVDDAVALDKPPVLEDATTTEPCTAVEDEDK